MEKKIELLKAKGYESKITNFLDSLTTESKLNKELLEKLDQIGDNPVAEPDIYEIINDKMKLALAILTEDEITSKYTAREVGDFLYAVEQKIVPIRNSEGFFKSTPNTENCKLPNFIESDKLTKLGREDAELGEKLKTAKTEAEKTKIATTRKKLDDKVKDEAFIISGLDISLLTEWEKTLVAMMVYSSATEAHYSSLGYSLGN